MRPVPGDKMSFQNNWHQPLVDYDLKRYSTGEVLGRHHETGL